MEMPARALGVLLLCGSSLVTAHIAAFGPGMYCKNGVSGDNFNNNDVVGPLYQLSKRDYWFQHERGCDTRPPPADEFLETPAGGRFTVQLANNQAFTNLSYNGSMASDWPDGKDHPEDWHGEWQGSECLPGGGWMHAQNQSMAQGTAFAISYESDISKVSMDNLVVFSVLEHTPWKLSATYEVPKQLQDCPEGGCTCAWLWVPKDCGQANMYMQAFRCKVTGTHSTLSLPLAKPKAPIWCKDDSRKCVKGSKQMIVFHQLEGDNVQGIPQYETPGYNEKCGFNSGAQNDIFDNPGTSASSPSATSSMRTSSASHSTSSTVIRHISSTISFTNTAVPARSTTAVELASSTATTTSISAQVGCQLPFATTITETVTSIKTVMPTWKRWQV